MIESKAGEHPFDTFKQLTGVQSSIHQPEITRADPDEPLGIIRNEGR